MLQTYLINSASFSILPWCKPGMYLPDSAAMGCLRMLTFTWKGTLITDWVQALLNAIVGMNIHTACDTLCH